MPFTSRSGPTIVRNGDEGALHFFQLYFTDEIWDLLVTNSNKYAEWKRSQQEKEGRPWEPVTIVELKAFMGVQLMMGILHLPRQEDYWQTKTRYLSTELSRVFSRDRFEQILRYLHVSDREAELEKDDPNYDKLQKVRPLIDLLCPKFEELFDLGQNITVDEAMIPYKGRLSFKQYMKAKPHKWGIKVFVLADSITGYIYRFFVYTGKALETKEEQKELYGLCTQAVLDLVPGLAYKGHVLYCDNYYTSPELFMELYVDDIYATGTARSNKKFYPNELSQKRQPSRSRVQRGYYKHMSRGPMTAGVWYDRRYVNFLSTSHPPLLADGSLAIVQRKDGANKIDVPCPPYLPDYIKYMRGVDKGDQLVALYSAGRKSSKAWRRIFFYLLECCILNSYILEGHFNARHKDKGRKKRDMKEYKVELATQLIARFTSRKQPGRKRVYDEVRLTTSLNHIAVHTAGKGRCKRCLAKGRRQKKEIRHETRIKCIACDVYLCCNHARNCFREYHELAVL